MTVNNLNCVSKKRSNWNLFEHKTKIRTYMTKLDENYKKKYSNLYDEISYNTKII